MRLFIIPGKSCRGTRKEFLSLFLYSFGYILFQLNDSIVAAEILMDSDEVLRCIYEYGYTAEQIASALSTDINLVALKVAHLATLGYNLHALEHKSNFLK